MAHTKKAVRYPLTWRNIAIIVQHTPRYFADADHVEILVKKPKGAVLPITASGYRSEFLHADTLAAAGGPAAWVQNWLDRAAGSKQFKAVEAKAAQLDFFALLTAPKPNPARSPRTAICKSKPTGSARASRSAR